MLTAFLQLPVKRSCRKLNICVMQCENNSESCQMDHNESKWKPVRQRHVNKQDSAKAEIVQP